MFASEHSSVLITGGTRGIGRGLAERFLESGAQVLITGRNGESLEEMRAIHPSLLILEGDIGLATDREALVKYIQEKFTGLNVIINNAGIQRRVELAQDGAPWPERQAEIDILLSAPVHLNDMLLPRILAAERPALIVNVTSGGAYVPQPFAPIYAACKAGLHSYTVNLRYALRDTLCRVVELIPPAVATELAGPTMSHGAPLDDFCNAVFPMIARGDLDEIGFGPTATPEFRDAAAIYKVIFERQAARTTVKGYSRAQ